MAVSLRRQLMLRLALPLLVLLALESVVSYALALHFSERAYDAGLYDSARSLAQQVKSVSGRATLSLPREALEIIQWDVLDRTYFSVESAHFGPVLGNIGLPRPPRPPRADLAPVFYDAYHEGESIRMVAIRLPVESDEITILVGETLAKRQAMTREIVLSMLVPGVLLTLMVLGLLSSGIRGGLSPLGAIARQIESRRPGDLTPMRDVGPVEVQPMVRALNEMLGKLAAAQASQRRFIANAAHQLRTPLAALQVQSERALNESNPAAHAQALQRVVSGTLRVAHISRQLLTLAKAEPEANTRERFADVDVAALVREVASSWVPQALERNADLGYAGPDEAVWMHGDSALLAELVSNLIDNALRYGGDNARITAGVEAVDAGKGRERVEIYVEDNGPGIPPEFRQTVFDRFVRLPGSRGEGCGLGLAIVREIAILHGGEAAIGEREGGGLRVTVRFASQDRARP
jgi:two-component system sensor histidine kinase TctE